MAFGQGWAAFSWQVSDAKTSPETCRGLLEFDRLRSLSGFLSGAIRVAGFAQRSRLMQNLQFMIFTDGRA
jgi:hypothetical protein